MRILVIGSGGREHALVWKIAQSKIVDKIFCAPGNGGMVGLAEPVNIDPASIGSLLAFAENKKIDLTVVGPEVPLAEGIVDRFLDKGLRIFGPSKELAMLEASKVFAKETIERFGVATAGFRVFDDVAKAKEYLREKGPPIVVKADGLASGKGVIVAKSIEEAELAIDDIMVKKIFGQSGKRILLEDCLEGEEASILVFSDGKSIVPLVSAQDHKRIFDDDRGPNTGGMGAYSPAPIVSGKIFDDIIKDIFRPVINGLAAEGKFYKGVLYAGVMITKDGPMVLEFNVRFGDPETQAIIPRLKSDLVEVLIACAEGKLGRINLEWDKRPCISVVVSSKGYPAAYEKHKEITGLEEALSLQDIFVFHAGTTHEDSRVFTSGGRVLAVTGFGKDIRSAKENVYNALSKIRFEGMHYRRDIGDRAIKIR